jgi:hypothetical protein
VQWFNFLFWKIADLFFLVMLHVGIRSVRWWLGAQNFHKGNYYYLFFSFSYRNQLQVYGNVLDRQQMWSAYFCLSMWGGSMCCNMDIIICLHTSAVTVCDKMNCWFSKKARKHCFWKVIWHSVCYCYSWSFIIGLHLCCVCMCACVMLHM